MKLFLTIHGLHNNIINNRNKIYGKGALFISAPFIFFKGGNIL